MMQIDLPTKENISAYITEIPDWVFEVLAIMIGICIVLIIVMGGCRTFISIRAQKGEIGPAVNKAIDNLSRAQAVAGAGGFLLLLMIAVSPIFQFISARSDMLHETCDQIEQAYNITLSDKNRHIIDNAILSDGDKVKDASWNYKNPLVEPVKLEEIWTGEDENMSSRKYYFMILDRTDSTASFELIEPTSDGKEWQKVPLAEASEANSSSQSK